MSNQINWSTDGGLFVARFYMDDYDSHRNLRVSVSAVIQSFTDLLGKFHSFSAGHPARITGTWREDEFLVHTLRAAYTPVLQNTSLFLPSTASAVSVTMMEQITNKLNGMLKEDPKLWDKWEMMATIHYLKNAIEEKETSIRDMEAELFAVEKELKELEK